LSLSGMPTCPLLSIEVIGTKTSPIKSRVATWYFAFIQYNSFPPLRQGCQPQEDHLQASPNHFTTARFECSLNFCCQKQHNILPRPLFPSATQQNQQGACSPLTRSSPFLRISVPFVLFLLTLRSRVATSLPQQPNKLMIGTLNRQS
jgi:hypothetical protein